MRDREAAQDDGEAKKPCGSGKSTAGLYLRDVLNQLPVLGPAANIDPLLPANWKAPVDVELSAAAKS